MCNECVAHVCGPRNGSETGAIVTGTKCRRSRRGQKRERKGEFDDFQLGSHCFCPFSTPAGVFFFSFLFPGPGYKRVRGRKKENARPTMREDATGASVDASSRAINTGNTMAPGDTVVNHAFSISDRPVLASRGVCAPCWATVVRKPESVSWKRGSVASTRSPRLVFSCFVYVSGSS